MRNPSDIPHLWRFPPLLYWNLSTVCGGKLKTFGINLTPSALIFDSPPLKGKSPQGNPPHWQYWDDYSATSLIFVTLHRSLSNNQNLVVNHRSRFFLSNSSIEGLHVLGGEDIGWDLGRFMTFGISQMSFGISQMWGRPSQTLSHSDIYACMSFLERLQQFHQSIEMFWREKAMSFLQELFFSFFTL